MPFPFIKPSQPTRIPSIPRIIPNSPVPILIPRVESQRIIAEPPAETGAIHPVPELIIPSRDLLASLVQEYPILC